MISDFIFDRKGGDTYNARKFYDYVREEEEIFDLGFDISRALDGGTEKDVKKALCDYIIDSGDNPKICNYINAVKWLEDDVLTYNDVGNKAIELDNKFENLIEDKYVEELVISNDNVRRNMMFFIKEFIDSAEFYLNHLKELDKKLKL